MKKFEKTICLLLFFTFTLFLNKEVLAGVWKSCCLQGCEYSNGSIVEIGILQNNMCFKPDCNKYICLVTNCGVSWEPCVEGWGCNPLCTRNNPTMTIFPSTQAGNPGQTLNYFVNITNRDSLSCGVSTFKLEIINCPSGWNCSLTTNSLVICPFKSNVSILQVTPPPTASNGTYSFTVKAYDEKDSSRYDFKSAIYYIGCLEENPTISISPFYNESLGGETLLYNITVTNMDSHTCGPSVFILNVTSCPTNWNCNLTTTSLLIPPQSSNSTTISVTSNEFSPSGNYSFSVKVAKINSNYSNETSAIYNIIRVGNCSETPPYLILSTPYLQRGADINATIKIICSEWHYIRVKDLNFSLKIDNQPWNECFLNEKGLISFFQWNGTEQDRSSSHYKKNGLTTNGEWYCDDRGCKHQSYNLYVYSHSRLHTLEINFVCPLPSNLSFGTHTLSVLARLY